MDAMIYDRLSPKYNNPFELISNDSSFFRDLYKRKISFITICSDKNNKKIFKKGIKFNNISIALVLNWLQMYNKYFNKTNIFETIF